MINEHELFTNLQQGANDVQKKDEEVYQNELRLLRKSVRGLDTKQFDKAVNYLNDEALPLHRNLVLKAFLAYASLFLGMKEIAPADLPLWLGLILDNTGSRKLPPSLIPSIDNLFSSFGLPSASILGEELDDPNMLYKLGLYDLLLEKTKESKNKLYWTLKTQKNDCSEDEFLNLVHSENITNNQKSLLKARYVVTTLQGGQQIGSLHKFYGDALLNFDFSSYAEKPCVIQILNSLNYAYMRAGNKEMCERTFEEIHTLIVSLPKDDVRNHLLGNYYFQKSKFSKVFNEKVDLLLKAESFDSGFFDYSYLVANLYHDESMPGAKKFYERALETSPFNIEIVNDYGCYLNEYNKFECEKFSTLLRELCLFKEDDFNE